MSAVDADFVSSYITEAGPIDLDGVKVRSSRIHMMVSAHEHTEDCTASRRGRAATLGLTKVYNARLICCSPRLNESSEADSR